jgi:hypothetical protein
MTRQLNRLTARAVLALKKPGRHADGGNLYVKVTRLQSAALSKSFTFMYLFEGKQREAGLGSCGAITLAQARDKAAGYRLLTAKHGAQEAAAARKTFGQCAAELIKSKRREWRSAIHAGQWCATIGEYCRPIQDVPVDAIDTQAVLGVLQPLWQRIPETASRLRGRIEAVLDFAKAHGLRAGENPAAWRGHLALILPKRGKLTRSHYAAMDYRDVPGFLQKLGSPDPL